MNNSKLKVLWNNEIREVEVYDGPKKWFENQEPRYTGFLLPKPFDPYGEPYTVVFTANDIINSETK